MKADDTIPIEHAHTLAKAAKASGTQLTTYFVEGANHCEAYGSNPQKYISLIEEFTAQHLNR